MNNLIVIYNNCVLKKKYHDLKTYLQSVRSYQNFLCKLAWTTNLVVAVVYLEFLWGGEIWLKLSIPDVPAFYFLLIK